MEAERPRATLFDPVRRREVPATPEEKVRQAVLGYLLDTLRVPAGLIGVEFSLSALEPGNLRRADIVVFRPGAGQLAPWLLVECKEPGTAITDAVAFQVAHYLHRIPSLYLMVSNGGDTRCLERGEAAYRLIPSLPYFAAG
jgi:hypothetical protein